VGGATEQQEGDAAHCRIPDWGRRGPRRQPGAGVELCGDQGSQGLEVALLVRSSRCDCLESIESQLHRRRGATAVANCCHRGATAVANLLFGRPLKSQSILSH
jgi:hypothetical protein